MEAIELTRATVNDVEKLQVIGRQTFEETFSSSNRDEDMDTYLDESFSREKLIKELQTESSQFYLAVLRNRVIGYLKVNLGPSQTELKDDKAMEIERIYVIKEYHGKKVGHILYNKALEVAEKMGVKYLWLGVWEENHRAIQFYRKKGFAAFDKHIFKLGDDEQTDIMMKKDL